MLPSYCPWDECSWFSIFASTVIITIAALNPWLQEYIPDIDGLQVLAISATQRWAFPGSCIEAMTLMLRAMQNKTNILQAGLGWYMNKDAQKQHLPYPRFSGSTK